MIPIKKYFLVLFPYACGGNHLTNLLSTDDKFYQRFTSSDYKNDLVKKYTEKITLELKPETFVNYDHPTRSPPKTKEEMLGRLSRIYNAHVWKGTPSDFVNELEIDNNIDLTINLGSLKFHIGISKEEYSKSIISKSIIAQGHNIYSTVYENNNSTLEVVPKVNNHYLKDFWFHCRNASEITGLVMTYPKKQGRAFKRVELGNKDVNMSIQKDLYKLPFICKKNPYLTKDNGILIDSDIFCELEGSYYLQELIKDNFGIILPNYIHDLHVLWLEMIDKTIYLAENN